MSRTTRARRRTAAALLSAAVAGLVSLTGAPSASADPFPTPWGTQQVGGAILGTYRALGSQYGPLGLPTTGEQVTPDRIGRFNVFQGGIIYWSPTTGAHGIWGGILGWYGYSGYENGPLGYPTTSQLRTPDGRAVFNGFQHGAIYQRTQRLPSGGVVSSLPTQVRGAIFARYGSLGWEAGPLGYPISDELGTPDGRGRFSAFENGIIYWTPWTGAHHVRGAVRQAYATHGYETGRLGYPITDELPTPGRFGAYNHFERGSIYWSPATGAYPVAGDIRDVWAELGWENSELGFPDSAEYVIPERSDGAVRQEFEFGYVERIPGEGIDIYIYE